MDSKSTTQAFLTILLSALLHTALLVLIIGIPIRQFLASHDPEALEYRKMPSKPAAIERPASRSALSNDLSDIPTPSLAPVKSPVKQVTKRASVKAILPKAKAVEKATEPAQAKVEEQKPKIIDVDFSKDQKAAAATAPAEKAAAEATTSEPAAEAVAPQPKQDELPQQAVEKSEMPKPVVDKFAGVQAADDDDTATEATSSDANPPAPDADATKEIDSDSN